MKTFEVELIKIDNDNAITYSHVVGCHENEKDAYIAAVTEAYDWHNHEYDKVLINYDGFCIKEINVQYDRYGNELYIMLDHYDWSSVINDVLYEAINEVGYSADISQFCYCDEFKGIVKPFEPVGGKTKKVLKDDWYNMQEELKEYFIDTLENMENEECE